TAFAAGEGGVLVTSTAHLNALNRQNDGKVALKTHTFPRGKESVSRPPPGGNLALITPQTAEKQKRGREGLQIWARAEGATVMVKTTGYMAPNNRVANFDLKDFYAENPNQYTAVQLLPYLTGWYAFPGSNGLKITDVLKDHLQSVMDGTRANEPEKVLANMASDVQALLPKTN